MLLLVFDDHVKEIKLMRNSDSPLEHGASFPVFEYGFGPDIMPFFLEHGKTLPLGENHRA